MFFNFFRSKPKFSVGQHAYLNRDMRNLEAAKYISYLKIEKIVWMTPDNAKSQWGYDGFTYRKDGPAFVATGRVLGALESTLSLADPQP